MKYVFWLLCLLTLLSLPLCAQSQGTNPKNTGISPEVIAALVAAAAAVLSSLLAIWGQVRVLRLTTAHERDKRQEDKRDEVERVMSRFREPLIRAAYDLQSRLYNIVAQGLLVVYWVNGTKEERDYVSNNTLFLVAQFFGWNEIIRREVQFLDLGDQVQTRRLSELQDNIVHLCLSDRYGRDFRVFAGDQRAIGERMIRKSSRGLECFGYADFVDTIRQQPTRIPQLDSLRQSIEDLAQSTSPQYARLCFLQNALIDLLDFLDPRHMRYPKERRSKLPCGR
jgi:hypothetical protein